MENISLPESKEISEILPRPGVRKKAWCAYVFDQETKQWDLKVYLKKSAIPPEAVQAHRCQMYIAPR